MTLMYDALPPSDPVVKTSDRFFLIDAINFIFQERSTSEYVASVEGGPSSCRVFLFGPYEGAHKETPRRSQDIVFELSRESAETENQKSWEIRPFRKDGEVYGVIATTK